MFAKSSQNWIENECKTILCSGKNKINQPNDLEPSRYLSYSFLWDKKASNISKYFNVFVQNVITEINWNPKQM